MPKLSDRMTKLECMPGYKGKRPPGMTDEQFVHYIDAMPQRERAAFITAMTDDDLDASIEYLKTITEQHHAST